MTNPKLYDLEQSLSQLSPIHFIGVNGSGMRPLAEFAGSFKGVVSGSDSNSSGIDSTVSFALEKTPHELDLVRRAQTIVISSAIPKDHPAIVLAQQLNLKILHRSELLALFTRAFRTITVAGTHGKTTTSAMIAYTLHALNLDPSWIIGAGFSDGLPSYRRGGSDILVIEADESDGSFLRYQPYVAVLNNVEPDHMDYYLSFDRLIEAFKSYVELVPADGALVYFANDPVALNLASACKGTGISFGSSTESQFELLKIDPQGLSSAIDFNIHSKGSTRQHSFVLPLTGQHNAFNALATFGVCSQFGSSLADIAKALKVFPGVKRRLQKYSSKSGTMIFDDYAHNPGKIQSCVSGLRFAFPENKIYVVFQPHRYSRISSLYQGFVSAFRVANISVIVLPVYAAGESHIDGYESESIARDIAQSSQVETFSVTSLKQSVDLIKSKVNVNRDIILSVGAGDVWKVAQSLSEDL